MEIGNKYLRIYTKNTAGRLTISIWDNFGFHFFPYEKYQQYGIVKEWFDGNLWFFGLGPLFLMVYGPY